MFEQFFTRAATVIQHRSAPYVVERERFLLHCVEQGYSRDCVKKFGTHALLASQDLATHGGLPACLEDIKGAADRVEQLRIDLQVTCDHNFRRRFIHDVKKWLQFVGQLQEPKDLAARAAEHRALLDDFALSMKDDRGLSPATIRNRRWHVGKFLTWFLDGGRRLSELQLKHIDEFFRILHGSGYSKVTAKIYANGIRAFVRHAERRSWCEAGIAGSIPGPRIYRQHSLPTGPSWEEIKKVIPDALSDSPVAIRDRAIILMFAVYGLRAGEVAGLRVADVDWENDKLRVRRPKPRSAALYPLAPEVGEAIARYLRAARPKHKSPSLFLKVLAPMGPMTPTSLYAVVSRYLHETGAKLDHYGPHALRHACAQRLLSQGLSLKEIGDHLGHRSSDITRVYAKVDMKGLEDVAAFDLGEVA